MKDHHSLVNQPERSATSIGENIREAKYAHSKADFVSKPQIALFCNLCTKVHCKNPLNRIRSLKNETQLPLWEQGR